MQSNCSITKAVRGGREYLVGIFCDLLFSIIALLLIAQFFFLSTPAHAKDAVLTWNAVTENANHTPINGDLAGYRVYIGTASGAYSQIEEAGTSLSHTVTNLQAGTIYYFAVTAFDFVGNESIYSNEVTLSVPGPQTTPDPNGNAGSNTANMNFDGKQSGLSDILTVQNSGKGKSAKLKFSIYAADGSASRSVLFGKPGDIPAPGDYNGDGTSDLGVVSLVKSNYVWQIKTGAAISSTKFGKAGDTIITGCNFDGDKKTDKALLHQGRLFIKESASGKIKILRLKNVPQSLRSVKSVDCADLDGDGKDELVLLAKGTFAARGMKAKDGWYLLAINASTGARTILHAVSGALTLLSADMNGDGIEDSSFASKANASHFNLNFYVGASNSAVPVQVGAFTSVSTGKFSASLNNRANGLVYADKATNSLLRMDLDSLVAQPIGVSLARGEKLVRRVNANNK